MRRLIPTIVSLFTAVGGHFINRRLDRGLFFTVIVFAWMLGMTAFVYFSFFNFDWNSDGSGFLTTPKPRLVFSLYGFAIIYLLSAILTFKDASISDAIKAKPISKLAITGGVIASLLGFFILMIFIFLTFTLRMGEVDSAYYNEEKNVYEKK